MGYIAHPIATPTNRKRKRHHNPYFTCSLHPLRLTIANAADTTNANSNIA